MTKPVIIALDFANAYEVNDFLQVFIEEPDLWIKVGMELFYGEGPQFITRLHQKGFHIFLDLKLYDIPHTVLQAMKQIGRLGVELTTVTGLGGQSMIEGGTGVGTKCSQTLSHYTINFNYGKNNARNFT